MLDPIIWGLIQGFTEFLPISSSGHLVLIPALLEREGPDLATSAMLHMGTLVAVLVYYRQDVLTVLRFDRRGRRLLTLLVIGTVPAVIVGLTFEASLERINETPEIVAVMLILTGVVLLATMLLRVGDRKMEDIEAKDSLLVGLAQSLALIPGVSRSGMTISAGLGRGISRIEAARFAFLLGIPAIAGAGLLEFVRVVQDGESIPSGTWVGMVVAGLAGYAAIALLLRILARVGLAPFGVYCVVFGAVALIAL